MIEKIKTVMFWIVGIAILVASLWGGFKLERVINWNLSYNSAVDEAIEERVAPLESRIEKLELELDKSSKK